MKILVTGGHVTPALAVADELRNLAGTEIVFVGRKHTQEGETSISLEYKEVTARGIRFIPLKAGRLTRLFSFSSLRNIFWIPFGFWSAYKIVIDERPSAILTFGGYLALPIAVAAYLKKIPVYTHEQTIRPGSANIFIAKIAKKVFVSFIQSQNFFPLDKVIVTGNPVRRAIFEIRQKPFAIDTPKPQDTKKLPVIYVTGGSLGSHAINKHIQELLPQLLEKYIVIHQTGNTKKYKDFEELETVKSKLPKSLKGRYFLRKHYLETEIGYVYSKADFVVGRAGANTFFELIALSKPAVFIPLPWAAHQEQLRQAEVFKQHEVGEIFHQHYASYTLFEMINKLAQNLENYRKNFEDLKFIYKEDAAQQIVREIVKGK